MSVWQPCGYPTPGAFAGAWFCRFRMCHARPDGLEVTTLGHYVERGGRLSPIMPGFNFVSFVLLAGGEGSDSQEIERAACNDANTATAQHLALLRKWETQEAPNGTRNP